MGVWVQQLKKAEKCFPVLWQLVYSDELSVGSASGGGRIDNFLLLSCRIQKHLPEAGSNITRGKDHRDQGAMRILLNRDRIEKRVK